MASIIKDRVQETTTSTGTGALTLNGAVAGYVSFSSVMSVGDTTRYCIVDGTANTWEVGTGAYSATNTLTRTTVEASSNSNASLNLAGNAGTVVFCTASASLINGLLSASTAATIYAPLANPTFAGTTTLGNNTNIGGNGSLIGSNVTFTNTFKYITSDYGWYLYSGGSSGVTFNVLPSGTAGASAFTFPTFSADTNGNLTVYSLIASGGTIDGINIGGNTPSAGAFTTLSATTAIAIASGGTGATTASSALTNLGAYPSSNPSNYIAASGAPVQSVAGRTGAITLAVADVSGAAPLASPTFTGTVSFSTPLAITSGGTGATTASGALTNLGISGVYAPLASPTFTGTVTAPTVSIAGGTINSTSIGATTASTGKFTTLTTTTAIGIASGGTGATTASAALTALGGAALSSSPTFTGSVTSSSFYVNGTVAANRILDFSTSGTNRFSIGLNSTAESGSNVGSDFIMNRYSDGGVSIGAPIVITRSTGVITLSPALPIVSGGTNATTATLARVNINQGIVALTSGTTIATNLSQSNVFSLTLATNATLSNPTNLIAGATYVWIIVQDSTGSRTLSYGTVFKWPGGVAPTLSTTANAQDVLTAVCDGTNLCSVLSKAFA